jgi:hypothetical protein
MVCTSGSRFNGGGRKQEGDEDGDGNGLKGQGRVGQGSPAAAATALANQDGARVHLEAAGGPATVDRQKMTRVLGWFSSRKFW